MKSHIFEFAAKDVIRTLALPLGGLVVFAASMHLLSRWSVLPPPRPALDLDRTILIHQAEAARSSPKTEIVLLGDSSCLMDVMADQLSAQLSRPVLNLGTLSYLDLEAHGTLLREFVRAHPGQLRAVLLLMHPEALRRLEGEPYHLAILENFLRGTDHCPPLGLYSEVSCALGLEIFRGRLLSRAIASPLPNNEYGRFYRFTADLERFMTRHHGSLIEPVRKPFAGSAEYRLATSLQLQSRAFVVQVPAGVKLFAGITPLPASFVRADYARQYGELLAEWSRWLGADSLGLPATLPDERFGRVTHLTETGAREYTTRLAQLLRGQERELLK